jgi:hypothetical protein
METIKRKKEDVVKVRYEEGGKVYEFTYNRTTGKVTEKVEEGYWVDLEDVFEYSPSDYQFAVNELRRLINHD